MPTFGYTSIGANSGNAPAAADELFACRFTSPADLGTITSLHVYLSNVSSDSAATAIYSDSSGPSTRLATSSGQVITAAAWYEFSGYSFVGSPNTVYWLAVFLDNSVNDSCLIYWDTGGSTQQLRERDTGLTYATFPDPFGSPDNTWDFQLSIYATYSVAEAAVGADYNFRRVAMRPKMTVPGIAR